MRFKGRHPKANTGLPIFLLGVVISISVMLLLWRGCAEEESPAEEIPKVVMPIRKSDSARDGVVKGGRSSSARRPADEKSDGVPSAKAEDPKGSSKGHSTGAVSYQTRRGDSLYAIAARPDVYGDGLQWTRLFRMNMDRFKGMAFSRDFDRRKLPEGMNLRIATPDEAGRHPARPRRRAWVVNVLSGHDAKRLVMPAIRLMKRGFHVYLVKAKVKGKMWIRLRVGFFKDSTEADTAKKKIITLLGVKGAWITEVESGELKTFGRVLSRGKPVQRLGQLMSDGS